MDLYKNLGKTNFYQYIFYNYLTELFTNITIAIKFHLAYKKI